MQHQNEQRLVNLPVVCMTWTKHGKYVFSIAGPAAWNSLTLAKLLTKLCSTENPKHTVLTQSACNL